MAEPLIQEITLQDKGFSEGVHSAQEELKQLGKENNNTGNTLKSLKSQFNSAKTEVGNLSARYHQLTEEQKKGKFGQALKSQLDEAKAHALQFRDTLDKIQDDLDSIKGKAKGLKTGGMSGGMGGGFDLNKMISGTLKKAGFGEMASIAEGLGSAMGGGAALGAAAMTAGVAAAGLAVKELIDVSQEAIQKSAEFGRSMSELAAITGVAGKAFDEMREQVMQVGKDTNVAFSEVARNFSLIGGALPELLQDAAGLEEVSRAAITLSKAGLMPLEEATSSLTDVMAQFGLGAGQAQMAIDVLANGSQAGAAEISQLSQSMVICGSSAKMAGVNFNQTTAMLETLAAKGLKGAEAGTQLRNVFLSMSTKGIDEINPKVVGVQQALINLSKHANDANFMVETFGRQNANAASILANNISIYNEMSSSLDRVGTAAEMASTNGNNLATKWQEMKTSWENFLSSFDVDNSPLMAIVEQIHRIITAVDNMVHEVMNTSAAQSYIEAQGQTWTTLGQAVESVIAIVGDLLRAFFEIMDLFGGISNVNQNITNSFKVLGEIIWWIETIVWAVTEAIHKMAEAWNDAKKWITEKVKDIPILSTMYEMLKKIKSFIDKIIQAYKDLKKAIGLAKEESRTGREWHGSVGRLGDEGGSGNGGDNFSEDTREKGIIEKKDAELKKLREQRDQATTESEIKRYNNLIKQKQKELNDLKGESSGGSGGKGGNKNTPNQLATNAEVEYANALTIIAAEKEFANKKDLEAEEDHLNALQKLRDSYIKIPKKTNAHIRRLNEINNQIRKSTNAIKKLEETERWAQTQNNMFKNLSQSTRQLSDGFIDEKEWEQRRINSVKKAVEELYSLSTLNKEQEKALQSYIKELKQFTLDDLKKDMKKQWSEGIHNVMIELSDLDNIVNDRPRMNEYYKDTANRQYKQRELSDDIVKNVNVNNPSQGFNYATSDEIIKMFRELKVDLDGYIKFWENAANDVKVGGYFVNLALLKVAEQFEEAGKTDLANEMRKQAKDMSVGQKELVEWINGNKELTDSLGELNIDFNKIVEEIKSSGNAVNAALLDVAHKLYEKSVPESTGKTKGDASNFNINKKSYERLSREVDVKVNTVGMDKFQKMASDIDRNLAKYKELEDQIIKLKKAMDEVPGEVNIEATFAYRDAMNQMDQLDAEIQSKANKLNKHLKFEVRMNNLQKAVDGLQNLQSIASNMNFLSNLNDELENCDNGFEEFIVHLQAVISIINIIQGTIEAFNTVMSLVGLLFGKSAVAAGADAAAKGADATATGVQAAAEEAAVPGKLAEAAANKTLEASVLDLAAAQIFAAHASIPFVGVGLASGFVTAMMTAMTAQHTASIALQAMAEGGIIDGSAFHGDTTLIRANKGEMVLNTSQQRNLFDLLDHGAGFASALGDVNFKIQGDALVGTLRNHNKIKSKTGHTLKF